MSESKSELALLSITQASKELMVGKKRIYQMIENREIGVIQFENGTIKIPRMELTRWILDKTTYLQNNNPKTENKKLRTTPEFDINSVMEKIIRGSDNE
jgi:excisionase family DNA binding protein